MPFVRDPQTGKVRMESFDPKSKRYTEGPFHKIKQKQKEFLNDQRIRTTKGCWPGSSTKPTMDPSAFLLAPDDPLLLPTPDRRTENNCANAEEREDLFLEHIWNNPEPWPLMNRMARLCRLNRLCVCPHEACVQRRSRLAELAPRCAWPGFRDWALQLLACLLVQHDTQQFTRPFFHLSAAISRSYWLLVFSHHEKSVTDVLEGRDHKKIQLDGFGIFEMLNWMMTIQASLGLSVTMDMKWDIRMVPATITEPVVQEAEQKARRLGLCINRFWKLVLAMEREHVDLVSLMEAAEGHPQLRQGGHEDCSVAFCQATMVNSTHVVQLHKCGRAEKRERRETRDERETREEMLYFDPELLNASVRLERRTVWTVAEPHHVAQSGSYMAVSHVWSDGTGIGLQQVGQVNACLFRYFASIAADLGCKGIWWDTISIPTDPALRRIEINRMHRNYAEAQCTVVHDNYLVDFDWTDDGAPCVAMVLSAWLTRGWTALELIMSRTVKVLFRDPTTGRPCVKDLDADILAPDPASCTRGHWVASTIIRELRKPIRNVSNLLSVLRPRSTSWPQDRIVIAGLLAGLDDLDASKPPDHVTRAILNHVARINPDALYHGRPTITESGGWSWCPASLFSMPAKTSNDLFVEGSVGDKTCYIDIRGRLFGYWHWRLVEEEEVRQRQDLVPEVGPGDVSTALKTRAALRQWPCCLLLKEDNKNGSPLGLLVTFVGMGKDDDVHVQFVGCVRDNRRAMSEHADQLDKRFHFDQFMIGAKGSIQPVLPHMYGRRGFPDRPPPPDRANAIYSRRPRPSPSLQKNAPSSPEARTEKPQKKLPPAQQRPVYDWLCGQLWLGDLKDDVFDSDSDSGSGSSFVSRSGSGSETDGSNGGRIVELLVVHPHKTKTNVMEGFSLRVDPGEPEASKEKVRGNATNRKHSITRQREFWVHVHSGRGSSDRDKSSVKVCRIRPDTPWPPAAIPAADRCYEPNDFGPSSRSLFQIRDKHREKALYAALHRGLFTPSEACAYKGIWTSGSAGESPGFLLLHQPYPGRLEVIALTGGQVSGLDLEPGSLVLVAEDPSLGNVSREKDGHDGVLVVSAERPSSPGAPFRMQLVSQDEIIVILSDTAQIPLQRVDIEKYL